MSLSKIWMLQMLDLRVDKIIGNRQSICYLYLRRSGGPAVEELALEGDAKSVKFNVPMKHHKNCNFSYAGLKTQVRLAIEAKQIDPKCSLSSATSEDRRNRADIAASFQVSVLEESCSGENKDLLKYGDTSLKLKSIKTQPQPCFSPNPPAFS